MYKFIKIEERRGRRTAQSPFHVFPFSSFFEKNLITYREKLLVVFFVENRTIFVQLLNYTILTSKILFCMEYFISYSMYDNIRDTEKPKFTIFAKLRFNLEKKIS